jgi:hypothetical protein
MLPLPKNPPAPVDNPAKTVDNPGNLWKNRLFLVKKALPEVLRQPPYMGVG